MKVSCDVFTKYVPGYSCDIFTKHVSEYVNCLDSIINYAHQDMGMIHNPHDHLFENSQQPSYTGLAYKYEKFAEKWSFLAKA